MPKAKKKPVEKVKKFLEKRKQPKQLKIKRLELEFTEKEHTFTRIAEKGDWCVYHKHRTKERVDHEECEVVRIDARPLHPRDPNPEKYDLAQTYPAPSRWGRHGFTVMGKARAIELMERKYKEGLARKK